MAKKQKIAIVGAGKAGCQALFLLSENKNLKIVAVADKDPTAPGVVRSYLSDIDVVANYKEIFDYNPDVILELTGDEQIANDLKKIGGTKVEIISGESTKFFFEILMQSKYQQRQLAHMVNISRKISRADYHSLVIGLLQDIALMFDAEIAGFLLFDPQTDELVAQKPAFGILDDGLIEKYRIPLSFDTIAKHVFETGESYFSNDPAKDEKILKSIIEMFDIRNFATVQLRAENENLGILHVANKSIGEFSKDDTNLLESLSGHIAMVLQNARLQKAQQERFNELASLFSASRSLTQAKDYNEILSTVAEQADNIMNASFGAVLLLDEKSEYLNIVSGHNLSESYIKALNEELKIAYGEGASGLCVKTKQPIPINNVFQSDVYSKWQSVAQKEGYASMIALPLLFHNEAIGALSLYFKKPRNFLEKDINLIMTVVNDAAIAISYAKNKIDEINLQKKLATVHELSTSLLSTLDHEMILKKIGQLLSEELDYDKVTIYTVNRHEGYLSPILTADDGSDKSQSRVFSNFSKSKNNDIIPGFGKIPFHNVMTENDHIAILPIFSKLKQEVNSKNRKIECKHFSSPEEVPFGCWGEEYSSGNNGNNGSDFKCLNCSFFKLYGLIEIDTSKSKRILKENDLVSLKILSEVLSTAMDNAMLYKSAQELAAKDYLTGLYNHGFFHEKLKELLISPMLDTLSIILLDIDNFKIFNDRFGHLYGDYCIKLIANTISENIRLNDIACRYGGDEFAIILPGMSAENTKFIASRIKESIESISLNYRGQELDYNLSASAGIAACPDDGGDHNQLIDSADKRLFAQKTDRQVIANILASK